VVTDICEVCNDGWMSRLEQEAQPILTPMLLDESRTFTAPEQQTVATWATKTTLVMQGANIGGEHFTPAEDYRWLRPHCTAAELIGLALPLRRRWQLAALGPPVGDDDTAS
jgi:alkylhydroperoxidase family enzyme